MSSLIAMIRSLNSGWKLNLLGGAIGAAVGLTSLFMFVDLKWALPPVIGVALIIFFAIRAGMKPEPGAGGSGQYGSTGFNQGITGFNSGYSGGQSGGFSSGGYQGNTGGFSGAGSSFGQSPGEDTTTFTFSSDMNDQYATHMINNLVANNEMWQHVLATGQKAEAKVLNTTDLGFLVNGDNPVLTISLEVYPVGGTPFITSVTAPVLRSKLYNYEAGKMVPVRFDPNDHSKVAVDRVVN